MDRQEALAKKLHAQDYDFQAWDECGELRKGKYMILAKAVLAKESSDLLDKKIHQIWLNGHKGIYEPWGMYTWGDEDYETAVRHAAYFTGRGYNVKLVTLIATFVL